MTVGPTQLISQKIHAEKYRQANESFEEAMARIANALKDNDEHFRQLLDLLMNQRFLPAGRVQAAVGAAREVTPYNCYVSGTIQDDVDDIMDKSKESVKTMRLGGGIGYDFSTLRPEGARILSLDSTASGPVSFMRIFDAGCSVVHSAGHRRGAQMGVLRIDHPDIETFIRVKQNSDQLTNFNISVGVTDEFMRALHRNEEFTLRFEGRPYKKVNSRYLWEEIMRATWDWAEPGVLFIDRINEMNNLFYCENIAATNPCGEQPLPPYGACLLGSFNLTKYLKSSYKSLEDLEKSNEIPALKMVEHSFDYELLKHDVCVAVRAMDNVIDQALYPLPQQKREAVNKRRMGLGVTGLANAVELMGSEYGSSGFIDAMNKILATIRDSAYWASVSLAQEKGPFPLFNPEAYSRSKFVEKLNDDLRDGIHRYGIRNSHLTSIAPTGTISLAADNVTSGLEPVWSYEATRIVNMPEGVGEFDVKDWAYMVHGFKGKKASDVTAKEHVDVLVNAQQYVDSAVSKTCNIGPNVGWDEFQRVYLDAYEQGAKGCTTFRDAGKRMGILKEKKEEEGAACYVDEHGNRTCE